MRYYSENNKVSFPATWSSFVKTTFVQYAGKEWKLIQPNQDVKSVVNLVDSRGNKPEKTAIFIHPLPWNAQRGSDRRNRAYLAAFLDSDTEPEELSAFYNTEAFDNFRPDPAGAKRVTLNKRQKKKLTEGIQTVNKQDQTMWAILKNKVPGVAKFLALCIGTALAQEYAPAVNNIAEIIDTEAPHREVSELISRTDPALTFVYDPYRSDTDQERPGAIALVKRLRDENKRFSWLATTHAPKICCTP